VVVDVETAGFNAQTDALLEVAAAIIDMNSEGHLYIKELITCHVVPFRGANLDKAALDFTGIDPYNPLRMAKPEAEALDMMFSPIRKAMKETGCNRAVLVGHNASFDHNFIFKAAERTAIKHNPFHPFSSFDTATLAGFVYGQTVLAKACACAMIEFDGKEAHSAKYDTQKTAELFCKMVNTWKRMGGEKVLRPI